MKYREKIVFLTPTTVDDGAGGTKLSANATTYTCWASVKALSGSRALEFSQITGKIGYEIEMRYQFDFAPTPAMQVQWRGKILTIHGAIDSRITEREVKFTAYA